MSWRDPIRDALAAGDKRRALSLYSELLAGEASARVFKLAAELAPACDRTLRLKVLRSFTAEPLVEAIGAYAARDGLALDADIAGHDQLEQEVFDQPADPGCDAVLIATRLTDQVPELGRGFASLPIERASELSTYVLGRADGWLPGLRRRFPNALLILLGFSLPEPPAYGLADPDVELGHRQLVAELNGQLAIVAGEIANAVFVDIDGPLARVGHDAALDPRLDALARQPYAPAGLAALGEHVARVLGAAFTPRRKCVVLDCDNTLWGGVVGEDGPDGIELGPDYPGNAYVAFQRAVLSLASRGVIVALASRNNEVDVLEILDDHPHQVLRRDHIAAWRIDWTDKATNLEALAAELGIGLDSMVFVDDSDFECALVRERLPEVQVVRAPDEPLELAPMIDALRCFDALTISETDRARGAMYKARAERETAERAAPSLESFLESLELVLTIEETGPGQIDRASQLTMRTNQLNATTRRYSPSDIEALVADDDCAVFHVRLADRFGDYGICGLAIARRAGNAVDLDTFLLSCRVIGRGVEEALVAYLERHAKERGADRLLATYAPTAKNIVIADLFDRLGFARVGDTDGVISYSRDLHSVRPYPGWFTINAPK